MQHTKKNELKPHLSKYWKIPPDGNCAFVAAMEDVRSVYLMPYDPMLPVVCMDESSKQLVGEVAQPIPMAPGHPLLKDDEYVRKGVAEIFLAVEPLAGFREVKITDRRTMVDWAVFIQDLVDGRYAAAERIVLVMDNLNTHGIASLYEAFPAAEALRIAQRLEIHHTPKRGSWLNIAEIELSVFKRQCLPERIPDIEEMRRMTKAWNMERNSRQNRVDWQFTAEDARIKLKRLYPKL